MRLEDLEDIDNIDIEEQMYMQESDEEEIDAEEEEDIFDQDDFIKDARLKLNEKNLEIDLSLPECKRKHYAFKKDKEYYEGYVLTQMHEDIYIFFVYNKDCPNGKTKKFILSDLYQVKPNQN